MSRIKVREIGQGQNAESGRILNVFSKNLNVVLKCLVSVYVCVCVYVCVYIYELMLLNCGVGEDS